MDIKFIPGEIRGCINKVLDTEDCKFWYPWLENLKNTNTFVHLSALWDHVIVGSWPQAPDPGYDYYVLSGDNGVPGWGEHVADLYHKPVIVIGLPEIYQPSRHELVTYIPNTYYHRQILRMSALANTDAKKNIRYKASALTSRITQSKIIVFAALVQTLKEHCLLSLHDRIQLRNVHNWTPTQNSRLDDLTLFFKNNFLHQSIAIEGDCGNILSTNLPCYTESALNFTQESFHYSLMYDADTDYSQILSGPFLTEKTFKCLLSKTAFIPVGQFRSYAWLKSMGMKFDYGLDLSFDDDAGNITRLEKIVDLIQDISKYSAHELFEMTESSTNFNYNLIMGKDFYQHCESANSAGLALLYEKVLG